MFGYSAAKLLAAVQIPLQATLITYAGAAGLAGVTLVTGVMLTPAREVVQEAIQPVGEYVQNIIPSTLPTIFQAEPPRLPIARPAAAPTFVVSVKVAPLAEPVEEAATPEATPTPAPVVISTPQRSLPAQVLPQPVVAIQPAEVIEPTRVQVVPNVADSRPVAAVPAQALQPVPSIAATAVPAQTQLRPASAAGDQSAAAAPP